MKVAAPVIVPLSGCFCSGTAISCDAAVGSSVSGTGAAQAVSIHSSKSRAIIRFIGVAPFLSRAQALLRSRDLPSTPWRGYARVYRSVARTSSSNRRRASGPNRRTCAGLVSTGTAAASRIRESSRQPVPLAASTRR